MIRIVFLCLSFFSCTTLWAQSTEEIIPLKPRPALQSPAPVLVPAEPSENVTFAQSTTTELDDTSPLMSRLTHCQQIETQQANIKQQLQQQHMATTRYYLKKHLNEQLKKSHAYCHENTE